MVFVRNKDGGQYTLNCRGVQFHLPSIPIFSYVQRMKFPTEPWRRTLYIIWASQFIAMMGMSLVVPFLPFYIRDLGVVSNEEVARWSGLVFAGPFFASFFLTPIWGYLGDQYGRKLMVVRAIFGLGVSQILIGFAQSVEMLFAFRMIQGAISGFLADMIGFRPIFFIVAALCIASGILIIKFVRETPVGHEEAHPKHTLFSNYEYAFRSNAIRIALAVMALSQIAVFMIQPIFALYIEFLIPNKAYLATVAGGIFSIAGVFTVIAAPWWGKRNDTKSYKKNLTIAMLGAGVAYAGQGLATNIYQLIVLRAVMGFCLGGMLPTLYSYIIKNASLERRGGIMGIAASGNILANMVGPPMGGYVASHLGLRETFFVTGGLLAATVLLMRKTFVDMRGSADPAIQTADVRQAETSA
jgi:DHA1 family multidrug resistance protein-like MFS transporter